VAIDHWEPPDAVLGYLPRIWCKACRNAARKVCDQHQTIKCGKCRNNITSAHVDLDYVGHADVTRALTMIDPEWDWEPCGWTETGEPQITVRGNKTLVMWGRLTLHGKQRICVGSCSIDKEDADKELVGDLIRNGAMRHNLYGALWSKAEGLAYEDSTPTAPTQHTTAQPPSNVHVMVHPEIGTPSTREDRAAIKALVVDLSENQRLDLRSWCVDRDIAITISGQLPVTTTIEQITEIRDYILTMLDDTDASERANA
jgi:hypothetical protein